MAMTRMLDAAGHALIAHTGAAARDLRESGARLHPDQSRVTRGEHEWLWERNQCYGAGCALARAARGEG